MIKIGFSTSRSLISRAIRWATRSKVSHCFFVVDDDYFGIPLVMEAARNGYALVPFEGYANGREIVAIFEPAYPLDEGVKASAKWLGTRYDDLGVLGMGLVIVAKWFGRKVKNPLASSHAVFCSEVLARVLIASKYPGSSKLDPNDASPQEMLDFLTAPKAAAQAN
jgi:hypothetical protein